MFSDVVYTCKLERKHISTQSRLAMVPSSFAPVLLQMLLAMLCLSSCKCHSPLLLVFYISEEEEEEQVVVLKLGNKAGRIHMCHPIQLGQLAMTICSYSPEKQEECYVLQLANKSDHDAARRSNSHSHIRYNAIHRSAMHTQARCPSSCSHTVLAIASQSLF